MTREEAIKLFRRDIECLSHDKCSDCILEKACDPMKTPPDSEYIEAYGMAIEALSAEPCEASAREWCKQNGYVLMPEAVYEQDMTKAYFEGQNAEPKTGHWVKVVTETDSLGNETYHYECSECSGWGSFFGAERYCPNCGAKMAESEDK